MAIQTFLFTDLSDNIQAESRTNGSSTLGELSI